MRRTLYDMAVPTDQEILDQARTALHSLLTREVGSATINGRSFTYLDLDKIQTIINTYESRVARATRRVFAGATFRGAR